MLGAGPAGAADAVCHSLGIAADHVAIDGFDGVEVTIDKPVRDAYAGLDLETAERRHLDGRRSLAYIRS